MAVNPSDRIRLVIITGGLGLGGSERQLQLVLSQLDPVRFERHIIVLNREQAYFNTALQSAGVKLWLLPEACTGIRQRLGMIAGIVRQVRPHVLHSWIFHNNPYAGLVGRWLQIPLIMGSQRNIYTSVQQRLSWPMLQLSLRAVPYMVVNSAPAYREMLALGKQASRLLHLPNGVELPDLTRPVPFPDGLEKRGIIPGVPLIGMVGNLRQQKNYPRFVRVLGSVLPQHPTAHGLIIGRTVPNEPAVEPEICAMIAQSDLGDRIHLLGQRQDVPALMRYMTVFCLTSDFEGTPNVVLEAMAAACPIVATAVGGVPDLVDDGINSLLVQPTDESSFGRAVDRLLNDRALRAKMGQAARQTAERTRNPSEVARKLAAFYEQHLNLP